MLLPNAIELVVTDTRENTDPMMTVNQVIDMVRDTGEDAMYGTEGELKAAYETLLSASDEDVNRIKSLIS